MKKYVVRCWIDDLYEIEAETELEAKCLAAENFEEVLNIDTSGIQVKCIEICEED